MTGAASGRGRAFAERFARAGMNVVLADIEEPLLVEALRPRVEAMLAGQNSPPTVQRSLDANGLSRRV